MLNVSHRCFYFILVRAGRNNALVITVYRDGKGWHRVCDESTNADHRRSLLLVSLWWVFKFLL